MGILGKIAKGTINITAELMGQTIRSGSRDMYEGGKISQEEYRQKRQKATDFEKQIKRSTEKW